jgi:hypothetical protein
MLENLKNALSKILATVTQVAKAQQDGKIVLTEWFQIGATVFGWIWIFKSLKLIKADLESGASAEDWANLNNDLKTEFDIPQDTLEDTIEQALSIVTLILSLVGKKALMLKE